MLRSLRSYVVLAATLFVVLVMAAAAVLVRQAEAAGRAQTRAQLLQTTRALALVVDARLEGYEGLLRALASSEAMQRDDFAALDQQARAALKDPEAWITLSDRTGRQLLNTRRPPGAPTTQSPAASSVWADLDADRSRVCSLGERGQGRPVVCVDVPVMRNGRAVYKLSLVFQPHLLQRIIIAQRVPRDRFATVLDRNGRVIWRSVDPQRFMGAPATPDMARQLQLRSEGVIATRTLDGTPTEAGFSRSPTSGWTFIVAIPEAELAASARGALRDGGIVAGVLLIVALLSAFLAARAIGRDLAGLASAAQRIRLGEPPQFQPGGFTEFDALGAVLEQAIAERDGLQERFDLAQTVGGIGSWTWDLLRDVGHVSETYKTMHGLTHVEGPLKFGQVLKVVHPDDRAGYLSRLRDAQSHSEPTTNRYRVVRGDGSIAWIAARGRAIMTGEGDPVTAHGIVRDVTAEHEAEAALRRLAELLEQQVEERTLERDRLWNLARDPFVVTDSDGVWLAASPAWSTLLGYPLEAFIGRTSQWLEHPDDVAKTRDEDRRLSQGEVTERFENRFRASDGSYRWLSWTAVPEGGRFYSVARDITVDKEQAAALQKAEQALREAQKVESIGQITGGVAHDFNNLLMPILSTLDLLQQRGLPDPRSERMVSNALEAGERARMLVQRLLAFARRQPLRTEPLDIGGSLERLRPLLETSIGPQVRLVIDSASENPLADADEQQFELAILNLAVNARDAMPEGGTLTLAVRLVGPDEPLHEGLKPRPYVEVSVSDTGVGMPPKVIERAIEPFFSTKGLGRGTGLGLSMVHGLMAQLGGGMAIASEPGQGTTVRLWLPLSEGDKASPVAAKPTAPARRADAHVLLVDDEALARAGVADMLEAAGYEVTQAVSGEEALTRLSAVHFDVLLTDHLMPGMSGVELAQKARTIDPALPVLIISGYADLDDIAPDLPRLAKPFRQSELMEVLASLRSIGIGGELGDP